MLDAVIEGRGKQEGKRCWGIGVDEGAGDGGEEFGVGGWIGEITMNDFYGAGTGSGAGGRLEGREVACREA